jgi:hypothetical protein
MSSLASPDPDTNKVLEVMRGASRTPRDPDVELATIISGLADIEEDAPFQSILAKLIRDANTD